MADIRILGISGSLRAASFNTATLPACQELCSAGMVIEIFDIAGIPPFNQDLEGDPPEKIRQLKERVRSSDGVLFVSPEYNYSIPGHLKNAIDWASRPYGDSAWDGKPALIMGATTGTGGTAKMQYHLRQSMVFLDMHPLNRPEVMITTAQDKFDDHGNLTDEATREHLRKALAAFADWIRRLKVKP